MKKVIALILVAMFALCLFAGCGGSGEATTSTGDEDVTSKVSEDVFSTDDVKYLEDNQPVYAIVKPDGCAESISSAASLLFQQMKKKLGNSGKTVIDNGDTTDYEILIGSTNREESKTAYDYLVSNSGYLAKNYVIGTIGKKIVIRGVTDESTVEAVNYFLDNFCVAEGVAGGIKYVFTDTTEYPNNKINGNVLGKYKIVRPHFNFSYLAEVEIENLQKTIMDKFGYYLEIVHDAYVEATDYEIVVGDTNRAMNHIDGYDNYSIKVDGKKVFLNGGHGYSTAMAVSEFTKLITAGDVTESSNVSESFNKTVQGYGDKTYIPTWYDDFDGNKVDTTKWNFVGENNRSAGKGGKIAIRSTDPNIVFVSDGCYQVWPKQDEEYYYGGMLRTDTTMNFKYGYVETSQKIPDGPGFWTALWACSNTDVATKLISPEIDITESFGNGKIVQANCHGWPTTEGSKLGYVHTSLDGDKYGNDKRVTCPDGKTFHDDFHTFGFLWDETQMTFTCDGDIYFYYDITTTPEDQEAFAKHSMYLIDSMACGFDNCSLDIRDATPEQWQETSALIVDYLYLYQFKDKSQELNIIN